jgi:hypothetical protein
VAQSTLAATLYLLMVRACQLSGAGVSVERGACCWCLLCAVRCCFRTPSTRFILLGPPRPAACW